MKQKHTGEPHLRFAVLAVDIVLLTLKDGELLARMSRVHRPPHFIETKGLPGGLIDPKETAEEAATRIICEKGGITSPCYLEQLATFSRIDRDPRGRVVAVAYLALVPWETLRPTEQTKTETSWWEPVRSLKRLAYDHDEILSVGKSRLASRIHYATLIRHLLPSAFTLTDLENAYEAVLQKDIDKRNFRKKILKQNILIDLEEKRTEGAHRPAALYSFKGTKVVEIDML